jgi:heptosyltransferase-2
MGAASALGARVEGARRILVLRRRALGDVLLTLPAVRALKESYPEARVEILVDPPFVDVVRGLPYVDDVLVFPDRASTKRGRTRALLRLFAEVRRRRYDVTVDALGTPRTAMLSAASGAPVRAGFKIRGRAWAYNRLVARSDASRPVYMRDAFLELAAAVGATTDDRSFAPAGVVLPPVSARPPRVPHTPPRVALAPGATWSAKAWPTEHYEALARLVIERWGARVTVYWGPGEEPLAERIVAAVPRAAKAPGGTIADLARRLLEEDVLVSTDSGARHVAVGVGVPTVALFGPTDIPTATPPEGPHVTLTHEIECRPCQRLVCPLEANWCLVRVTPERVLERVADVLGRLVTA